MSHKTSKARVEAFFTALAETGNQTIAAERARVSRDWARKLGNCDPAFRARMDACIAEAEERLLAADRAMPPERWTEQDGEALVIRGCGRRRAQIARVRLDGWSADMEARFLSELAATCNAKRAAAAIGVSAESAHQRRKRWRRFDEQWDEALAIGYTRLEFMLIDAGCNLFEGKPFDPDSPIPPMTVDQVLLYLSIHRKAVLHNEKRPHWRRKPRNPDEIRASILRKLDIIQAHDENQLNAREAKMLDR